MKQVYNILLLIPFFFFSMLSAQPIIGTTTFDGDNSNIAIYSIFPRTGSVQGWSFYVEGSDGQGGVGAGAIYHSGATVPSYVSVFTQDSLFRIRISSEDDSAFNLDHIIIQWINISGDFTMRSYLNGSFVGEVTLNATNDYTDYDLSDNTDFDNIDEIRLFGFSSNSDANVKIDEITISAPTLSTEGVDNNRNNISIYPNPSSDFIIVKHIDNTVNYQVIDLRGVIVRKGRINQSDNRINLTGLTSGLYLVKVDDHQSVKILKT